MNLIIPSQVVARNVEDEVVILHLETESYFGLDEVGAVFWRALVAGKSFEEAVVTVLDEYEIDAETAEQDLKDLVAELASLGLLERGP